MKKNLIFLLFLSWNILVNLSYGRSYPVQEITGKFCDNFQTECTIPLPTITKADYLKYQNNPLYRRIYTVLRGGTYFWGRDFGLGAHKGVDIASKLGTPIYAIGNGIVLIAEKRGDRGGVITIQHQIWNRFIYSNYAHLDEILVKPWDQIKEKSLIAKMGNTGNSTGPHLHFQIDTNEWKHPYHPGNCGWETLMQIVNEARCRKQIQQNTLDPILFLETQGEIFLAQQNLNIPDTTQPPNTSYFLDPQHINISIDYPILKLGKTRELFFDHNFINHPGFLKDPITIESKHQLSNLFPDQISFLGIPRKVIIKGEKSWLDTLIIKSGNKILKEIPIFILDDTLIATLKQKMENDPLLEEILQKL